MIFLAELGSLLGLMAGMLIGLIFVFIIFYVYSALALMTIAKRTNTAFAWLAWIPYANIYLISKIAQKHWWPVLLLLPSITFGFLPENIIFNTINTIATLVFVVYVFIWWWKICQRRGKPGWWVLIGIIPIIGWIWMLVLIGILAWGKDSNPSTSNTSNIPSA